MAEEAANTISDDLIEKLRAQQETLRRSADSVRATLEALQKTAVELVADATDKGISLKDLTKFIEAAGLQAFKSADGVVIAPKGHAILSQVKSTDGVQSFDFSAPNVAGAKIRSFNPGGKGSSREATKLTYIYGGSVAKDEPAKLQHLGVDIHDWVEQGNGAEHLAVSLLDSARSGKKNSKHYDTDYSYGPATLQRTREYKEALAEELIGLGEAQDGELAEVRKRLEEAAKIIHPGQDPMNALKMLTTVLNDAQPMSVNNPEEQERAFTRVSAYMPFLGALVNRRINEPDGNDPEIKFPTRESITELCEDGNLENFSLAKFFVSELGLETSTENVKAADNIWILHMDHAFNASTMAATDNHSAGTYTWEAMGNGVGTLHGTRHGGANVEVLDNLSNLLLFTPEELADIEGPEAISDMVLGFGPEEIATRKERAAKIDDPTAERMANAYLDSYIKYYQNGGRELIPGIGHRVYKNRDCRAPELVDSYESIMTDEAAQDPFFKLAKAIEKGVAERDFFGDKGLSLNVDFYSGIVMRMQDIKENLFTVIFAGSRANGWMAQIVEKIVPIVDKPKQGQAPAINRPFELDTTPKDVEFGKAALANEAKARDIEPAVLIAQIAEKMSDKPDPASLSNGAAYKAFVQHEQELGAA